jgi:MraZ protein
VGGVVGGGPPPPPPPPPHPTKPGLFPVSNRKATILQICKQIVRTNRREILAFNQVFIYTVYVCGRKWEEVERRYIRRSTFKGRVEHMFLGQYQHNIDSKGRLTIPARFRELLVAEGAYVTQGFDNNLMVLTVTTFTQIYQRVNRMSMTDPMARLLKRLIFSNADRVDVDKVGRILIPQFLRDAVELDGEAVIVGVGDYFEIWSTNIWQDQITQLKDVEANAQRFMALDLSPGM